MHNSVVLAEAVCLCVCWCLSAFGSQCRLGHSDAVCRSVGLDSASASAANQQRTTLNQPRGTLNQPRGTLNSRRAGRPCRERSGGGVAVGTGRRATAPRCAVLCRGRRTPDACSLALAGHMDRSLLPITSHISLKICVLGNPVLRNSLFEFAFDQTTGYMHAEWPVLEI